MDFTFLSHRIYILYSFFSRAGKTYEGCILVCSVNVQKGLSVTCTCSNMLCICLSALAFFFNIAERETDLVKRTVDSVIKQTKRVQTWFESQRKFIFYSSSLLILYEGQPDSEVQNGHGPHLEVNGTESDDSTELTELKMIDFTHVFSSEGKLDENYLEGIEKFLEHLRMFRNGLTEN